MAAPAHVRAAGNASTHEGGEGRVASARGIELDPSWYRWEAAAAEHPVHGPQQQTTMHARREQDLRVWPQPAQDGGPLRIRAQVVDADAHDVGPGEQRGGTGLEWRHAFAGDQSSQDTLPAKCNERRWRRLRSPVIGQLAGHGCQDPRWCGTPGIRHIGDRHRRASAEAELDPTGGGFVVVEDGPAGQRHPDQVDPRVDQQVQLPGIRSESIDTHQGAGPDTQSGAGQCSVRDATAQSPATWIGGVDVPGCGADDHYIGHSPVDWNGRLDHRTSGVVRHLYSVAMSLRDGEQVWFYELHEGDDELYSDVLLYHDTEYDEQELLELVLEARTAVLDSYSEDTLGEAIANELSRRHGFLVVDDTQLRVAITVSAQEGETAVANVDLGPVGRDDDDDHRSILIDVEPEERLWGTD